MFASNFYKFNKKHSCALLLTFPSPVHSNYQSSQLPVAHYWGLEEQNYTTCCFLIKKEPLKPEIKILKNLWRVSGAVALWSVCRMTQPLTHSGYNVMVKSLSENKRTFFPFCFHSQAFPSSFMTTWKSQIHIWPPMTRNRKSIMRLERMCYQDVIKISAVFTILLHASAWTV